MVKVDNKQWPIQQIFYLLETYMLKFFHQWFDMGSWHFVSECFGLRIFYHLEFCLVFLEWIIPTYRYYLLYIFQLVPFNWSQNLKTMEKQCDCRISGCFQSFFPTFYICFGYTYNSTALFVRDSSLPSPYKAFILIFISTCFVFIFTWII